MSRILVVDDESSMRQLLEIALTKEGYQITVAESGAKAVTLVGQSSFELVISDLKMPDMSGVEVLRHVKRTAPDLPVIMMTAYASTETAVEALRLGAYDYITKPFKLDELKVTIRNALEKKKLKEEVVHLKRTLKERHGLDSILGRSPKMIELFGLIEVIAPTQSTVLVTGESGTGKELVARAIHLNSLRQKESFVSVNCGALPETLLESELFGHMRGSFTGAVTNKKGLFEAADRGSIFLDEIAEMSPAMQVKFLRVLQEKRFRRIGASEEMEVDVRVIAATNKTLEDLVREKQFREDLYYRLNVIPIHLPPLRERRDDIPLLAQHFLAKSCTHMGKTITTISEPAMEILMAHEWPGNVRELENVIERAVALEGSSAILPERMPENLLRRKSLTVAAPVDELSEEGVDFTQHVAGVERRLLQLALDREGGVQTRAARLLNLNLRSFRYLLQKYGLK